MRTPPDYESQKYWISRFETESRFEWLGDGADTILPVVRNFLDQHSSSSSATVDPPRLLHIGAGTSCLSDQLHELYSGRFGPPEVDASVIVNTDFAENLVRKRLEALASGREGVRRMQWVQADALQWEQMQGLRGEPSKLFSLVVDKSTSDAISCNEDIVYTHPTPREIHPIFSRYAEGGASVKMSPVEVLAVHLASLTASGGAWIALSYSRARFDFLQGEGRGRDSAPNLAEYWTMERVVSVDAPSGVAGGRNVHTPAVQHYIYVLRRTDVDV